MISATNCLEAIPKPHCTGAFHRPCWMLLNYKVNPHRGKGKTMGDKSKVEKEWAEVPDVRGRKPLKGIKKFKRKYRGGPTKFWKRIEGLPEPQRWHAYAAALDLQKTEHCFLRRIEGIILSGFQMGEKERYSAELAKPYEGFDQEFYRQTGGRVVEIDCSLDGEEAKARISFDGSDPDVWVEFSGYTDDLIGRTLQASRTIALNQCEAYRAQIKQLKKLLAEKGE